MRPKPPTMKHNHPFLGRIRPLNCGTPFVTATALQLFSTMPTPGRAFSGAFPTFLVQPRIGFLQSRGSARPGHHCYIRDYPTTPLCVLGKRNTPVGYRFKPRYGSVRSASSSVDVRIVLLGEMREEQHNHIPNTCATGGLELLR